MFHQNIGTPVRSSTKYLVAVGLVIFLIGMGYSVYLYKKASSPPDQEETITQQQRQAVVRESSDCTYTRPCKPALEPTKVPWKHRVCFDPPMFADLEGFGLMVSFGGAKEHRYSCTLQEVVDGVCKEGPYDMFRFVPKEGVTPPRHWFVKEQGIVCPS